MEHLNKTPWKDWEIVRFIDEGSFGQVYEIQRILINGVKESAAMKFIRLPKDDAEIKRFRRMGYSDEIIAQAYEKCREKITEEYSLVQKLDGCVNVVHCKDICYEQHEDGIGWDIYIRMELLNPICDTNMDLIPEEAVVRLGCDICRALVDCQKLNIVHRDIKPANILVSANGVYKLGDFGIARIMEQKESGTSIGSVGFMAPEIYFHTPYDHRVDIYSLGLVLYWLLNGCKAPFSEDPTAEQVLNGENSPAMRRIKGEPLPLLSRGSERLQKIVMKACAYKPEDRYSSATEMLADLQQIQAPVPPPKKNKVFFVIATVLGVLCAVAVIGLFLHNRDNEKPVPTVSDSPTSVQKQNQIHSVKTLSGEELDSSNAGTGRTFAAENVIDGKSYTCWCVNTANKGGAGASLLLELNGECTVSGIQLVNGNLYLPEEGVYKNNGQVEKFMLTFADGSTKTFTADFNEGDVNKTQNFYFDQPVITDSIVLTVMTGYAGEKYTTNVCISEISLYAEKSTQTTNAVTTTSKAADVLFRPESSLYCDQHIKYVSGYYENQGYVKMRFGPSKYEYDVIRQIDNGSPVTVETNSVDGWSLIYFEEKEGWVRTDFLFDTYEECFDLPPTDTFADSDTVPESYGNKTTGYVANNTPGNAGLNVRSEASYNSTKLTTLSEGEQVDYYPDTLQNGYVCCELSEAYNARYGWILLEYLTTEKQVDLQDVYKAYYEYVQEIEVNDNTCAEVVDINGDSVPELILRDYGLTVYTYDANSMQMVQLLSVASGKVYTPKIAYNPDKNQVITQWGSTGGGGYEIYEFHANDAAVVYELERSNGKFTESAKVEYLINGDAVSEAEYNEMSEKIYEGFTLVEKTLEEIEIWLLRRIEP